jgi:two-component system phosphate regulon sensor histidine kinase PhoR
VVQDRAMRKTGYGQKLVEAIDANLVSILVLTVVIIVAFASGLAGPRAFLLWVAGGFVLVLPHLSARDSDPVPSVSLDNSVGHDGDGLIAGVQAGLAVLDTPVVVLDRSANVLFQNDAAEQTFGAFPIGEHISAKLRSPVVLDVIRETIASSEPRQIEYSEKLPVERDYVVRVAPSALSHGDDEAFYCLTIREITDLRRIDRMRSDFVANASHELRTPLASLRGFIETLLGPAKDDVKARERFLNIMLEQATRMSRLVDDLLSLSRLELRANIAPDQRVELNPLLRHVHDTLLPLANELDVTVNLHLPEQNVAVTGDRDELVQVFQNLLENACKYGQEGKEVDVVLRAENGTPVEVSIIDKGAGIPAEHLPRLTERFYRVSITDSRSKKGTGLGLAIVKHILMRHKARLIVRSQLGEGTDFTVRF